MSKNVRVNMDLLPSILQYAGKPEDVPLSVVYNGRAICGLGGCGWKTLSEHSENIDSNVRRTVIEGRFRGGLAVRAEYTEYLDFPVTEWLFFLSNSGKEPIRIAYADVGGKIRGNGKCILTSGNGDTCREDGYSFTETEVDEEVFLSPADGTSCKGAFPYLKLKFDDIEVRAAIGWPSRWNAVLTPEDDGVTLYCGQENCDTVLNPGEVWRTPRLTLMAYTAGGTPYRGINIWRRWYFAHILPKALGAPAEPLLCLHNFRAGGLNEFCGATEENQISALMEYRRRGINPDVWWIDAGWYPCNGNWPATGSWKHDAKRFANGLAPIGDTCAEGGTRLLLWFEPERVRPGTELYEEHRDWLLSRKDATGAPDENYLLDLGNKDALLWLEERADSLIKQYGVEIYRQDFNFDPAPYWQENDAPDRQGFLENRHVQGWLAFWDFLLERNPGLRIDSCASGGRRNDLETMRRAFPLHYTDAAYGKHPVKQKQFREMFEWIPYFRSHNMNWDSPDGSYGTDRHDRIDEFSYMNALAPALTSMLKHDAPEEDFALTRRMTEIWRECASLELSGDYYPLTECRGDAGDWYLCQFDDSARRRGCIIAVRNVQAQTDVFDFTPVCVLPGAAWTVRIAGEEFAKAGSLACGDRMLKNGSVIATSKLQKTGLSINLPKRSGAVIFYRY